MFNQQQQVISVSTFMTGAIRSTFNSSPSLENKKKIRKKKRKIAEIAVVRYNLLHIPRILKNDLRRQYPVMFSNVYNSADYQYMSNFMNIFHHPSIELDLEKHENGSTQRVSFTGIDSCGTEWFERMHDAADLIFSLQNIQFKARSDGTAIAFAKFLLSGTKFLLLESDQLEVSPDDPQPTSLITVEADDLRPQIPIPSESNTTDEGDLTNDVEFQRALEDCLNSLGSEPSIIEVPSLRSLKSLQPTQEILYRAFDESMNLQRSKKEYPTLSNSFPVAVRFIFSGEFENHINEDSKIVKTVLRIFVS